MTLDVHLQIGDALETVTVNANGSSVRTTDASISTVIDRQFVENIPLDGHSFQSLMTG